ncbi:hypothetical protein FHS83_001285 [Rhizomicrobium palustre]|uniref:DUF4893 domain-containing protein n=1 Tax=Rhizomicrobium palustre TaxID=189966 RepID=A0A846MYC0_9PROT|nr:DUF4893 domain-containing protein [Rhizomicrobium palustre]NIK87967.1 hypothetical protein [Rhizomicrobium palustre]
MKAAKADQAFCPRYAGEVVSAANRRGLAAAITVALLFSVPALASWQDEASPRDADRLAHLNQARGQGLEDAARGNPGFYAAARSILSANAVASDAHRLVGTWHCRTMKLGGATPSIVYGWFRCRIAPRGDGTLSFEKLGGSTRISGTLYPDQGGFVYLGAQYVTAYGPAEKKPAYSGKGASAGANETPDDQIGLLTLTADGRARLELPYPVQESDFDVIELKR